MDVLAAQYAADDSSPIASRDSRDPTIAEASHSSPPETAVDENESDDEQYRLVLPSRTAAPAVSDALLISKLPSEMGAIDDRKPLDPSRHIVKYNPTYDQLWAPVEGPAHPYAKDGIAAGMRNHKQGWVEDASLDPFVFEEQYHTFQAYGYGVDPASVGGQGAVVGCTEKMNSNKESSVFNMAGGEQKKRRAVRKAEAEAAMQAEMEEEEKEERGEKTEEEVEKAEGEQEEEEERRRMGGGGEEEEKEEEVEEKKELGDASDPTSEAWLKLNWKSPWAGKRKAAPVELTEEQKKYAEEHAKKKEKKEKERGTWGEDRVAEEEVEEKSTFHGKEAHDYQGRSWLAHPKDAKLSVVENMHCYIPKRCIHTWSGHTKGVAAIRFFPKYGHLLLSGSMDTKIKIWDVVGSSKKCMRTYMGHSKAVKDIWFSNDGAKFLSASYDRRIKFWDTETGQVTGNFGTGKMPYVVRLHPDSDKQNILLAGMSDKKIVQWDMRSGEITQEYNEHLGAVNTITFIDENRRFVTSSDDKSLRVWEFGIPVVVKYISEPHMHSMPAISVHPNGNWVAAQSLDNQILIYGARDRFRLNKKKRFAGHIIAGYACQVGFSPDGRFIFSGDGQGKCWFWDWKSGKVFRTMQCHDGVCIGAEWHPLEQSRMATCGWDGLIKYWD